MNFQEYGLQQLAIGNDAKARALVSYALLAVSAWQDWQDSGKKVSMEETFAGLKSALILAQVAETSRDRFLNTSRGLATRFNVDLRADLASVRADMADIDKPAFDTVAAVAAMVSALSALGADSLGYIEAYAKGGKPALAAEKAKAEAKAADLTARASFTAEQAAEQAEKDKAEAEEKAADLTPRAKAAKQAAAILGAIAKHGENMSDTDLRNIAEKIGELTAARIRIANDLRAMQDKAAADKAAAEEAAKPENRAEVAKAAAEEAAKALAAKEVFKPRKTA